MNLNFEQGYKKRKSSSKLEIKFYDVWSHLKRRCQNKNDHKYKHYGERGITFEWSCFNDFYNEMFSDFIKHIKKYGIKNTSLDRIDCNKNYSKNNCRWATQKVQQNNRRNNTKVIYKGNLATISQVADINNISYKKLWERLKYSNMPIEIAILNKDLRYEKQN